MGVCIFRICHTSWLCASDLTTRSACLLALMFVQMHTGVLCVNICFCVRAAVYLDACSCTSMQNQKEYVGQREIKKKRRHQISILTRDNVCNLKQRTVQNELNSVRVKSIQVG